MQECKRIMTVAVIGGGASGLAAAKCVCDEGLIPVVFERAASIGGVWKYQEDGLAFACGLAARKRWLLFKLLFCRGSLYIRNKPPLKMENSFGSNTTQDPVRTYCGFAAEFAKLCLLVVRECMHISQRKINADPPIQPFLSVAARHQWHLMYEVIMLRDAAIRAARVFNAPVGTHDDWRFRSSLAENFALHFRVLCRFFCYPLTKNVGPCHDINVNNFINNNFENIPNRDPIPKAFYKLRWEKTPSGAVVEDLVLRADKELAHLTALRKTREHMSAKIWEFVALFNILSKCLSLLLQRGHVPPTICDDYGIAYSWAEYAAEIREKDLLSGTPTTPSSISTAIQPRAAVAVQVARAFPAGAGATGPTGPSERMHA